MVESADKIPIITTEQQLKRKNIKKFLQKWSVWECYVTPRAKQGTNFGESIKKVFDFEEIEDFVNFFAYMPHGKPSQLFFDTTTQEIKKFKINEDQPDFKQIDVLCLFKEGIRPEWEDDKNKEGGSHHYTLPDISIDALDKVWLTTCCYMVGGCYPHNELINGIRLQEKVGSKPEQRSYKIEFWLINDQEKSTEIKKMHNKIFQEIVQTLQFCEIYQYQHYQYRQHSKK